MKQLLAFACVVLLSCNQENKQLQESIRQLKMRIGVSKQHIEERAAAIARIGSLDDSLKRSYRYDSLVNVQKAQAGNVQQMEEQLRGLEEQLEKTRQNK